MTDVGTDKLDIPAAPHVTLPDAPPEMPTRSEADLANYVRELFYRARTYRRPLIPTWNRNYRLLRNRTWLNERAAWLPSPEVPEIRPILSSLVGWMTDQRPTYTAVPAASPHTPYFNVMSKLSLDLTTVLDSLATVLAYEAQIKMSIWDSYAMGTGILKTSWDMSLDGGLGNALLQRVDPYTFYPDPAASNTQDGNFYIEAHTMSVQEIDRRFRAGYLFPGGNLTEELDKHPTRLDQSQTPHLTMPGQIAPISPSTRSASLQTNNPLIGPDPTDRGVTVLECWMREHTTTQDALGEESIYDYWRVVVVAGNHVLLDTPAYELWSSGQHPYQRFVVDDEGEFWGQSLVEDLSSSQITLNRLLASVQHNIELTGNPPFVESSRSGIQRTKITNRPGQRITANDVQGVRWMDIPQLHPIIPSMIQFYVTEMERISGLSAMNRGFTPTGRNASDVLDSVQEAGFTRIRSHLRSLEWALRAAFDQIAALVTENYTVPRLVAVTGPDGTETALALGAKHFHVPMKDPKTGEITQYPLRFTILSHLGAHISQQQQRAEAIQLYTLGLIDKTAALDALDYPGREEIAQRITRLEAIGAFNPPGARQRAGH